MIANLLAVAGVDHVITIDLHASQMQGFFQCPVDNLVAEPLIARWLRHHVKDWQNGVVVSKNPGGTKRVTSLADALKLSFGIVTTDRRRPREHYTDSSLNGSVLFEKLASRVEVEEPQEEEGTGSPRHFALPEPLQERKPEQNGASPTTADARSRRRTRGISGQHARRAELPTSPLARSALPGRSPQSSTSPSPESLTRAVTAPGDVEGVVDEFTDEVR